MPSKQKQQTDAEKYEEAERTRLRNRAEASILQRKPPAPTRAQLPAALRRCDGADIVKRNTSRRKRYLLMFPGAFKTSPGAHIGNLEGLATKTPRLLIDTADGRILLKGFLAFPRNALMMLKGGVGSKRAVQVIDCFDTVVVFTEWAWVGVKDSNPGAVPEPLPDKLLNKGGPSVWRSQGGVTELAADSTNGIDDASSRPEVRKKVRVRKVKQVYDDDDDDDDDDGDDDGDDNDDDDFESDGEDDIPPPKALGDDDDWGASHSRVDADKSVERRVNPTRARRKVNYSQLDNDSEDEIQAQSDDDDDEVIAIPSADELEDNAPLSKQAFNFEKDDDDDIVMQIQKEEKAARAQKSIHRNGRKQMSILEMLRHDEENSQPSHKE